MFDSPSLVPDPGGVNQYTFPAEFHALLDGGAIIAVEAREWAAVHVDLASTSIFVTRSVPAVVCGVEMSQGIYANGDTIQADVLRIANPGPDPVAAEWKVWLGIPGFAPIGLINMGAAPPGSLTLPSGLDLNLGPLPLIPVSAGLPRGTYDLSCRLLDPATGALLAEDLNPFDVQ